MKPRTAEAAARTIAGECLVVRTRVLNRVITGLYEEELRPLGVTSAQINILVAVIESGEPTAGEICRLLSLEKSTLSRNLERMEERGWIRRRRGDDPRSRHLALTAKGRRLVVDATPAWRRAQDRAEELLGPAGAAAVFRAGDRLLRSS